MLHSSKPVLFLGSILALMLLASCLPENNKASVEGQIKTERKCDALDGIWMRLASDSYYCYQFDDAEDEYRKTATEKRDCKAKNGFWVGMSGFLSIIDKRQITDEFDYLPCMTEPEFQKLMLALQQAEKECLESGSRWGAGGLMQTLQCFPNYSDGGKACNRASDCQGMCLSESRTCQKAPSFGCISHLDDKGQEWEICID